MQKDSFLGIIERYIYISHNKKSNGILSVSNKAGIEWDIILEDKKLNIQKKNRDGEIKTVCYMPYANINRCWIEYRKIPYFVIRTGYPTRRIYIPFPNISKGDRERILTTLPSVKQKKKKRPPRKFESPLVSFINNKPVIIYTDGSCHLMDKDGTGIGGWAYSITVDGKEITCGARIENIATNGDMEIKAVSMALRRLMGCHPEYIIVMSDYQDVSKFGRGKFKPRFYDPRKNAFDVLEEAIKTTHCSISWSWVKGHNGNRFNELCDKRLKKLLKGYLTK